jgi:hypothetical protein
MPTTRNNPERRGRFLSKVKKNFEQKRINLKSRKRICLKFLYI